MFKKICFFILILIILQGIVGWYMVKSGLVNDITVSHYRLATHLSLAIVIISTIFWLLMNIVKKENKTFLKFSYHNLPFIILIGVIFAICWYSKSTFSILPWYISHFGPRCPVNVFVFVVVKFYTTWQINASVNEIVFCIRMYPFYFSILAVWI